MEGLGRSPVSVYLDIGINRNESGLSQNEAFPEVREIIFIKITQAAERVYYLRIAGDKPKGIATAKSTGRTTTNGVITTRNTMRTPAM